MEPKASTSLLPGTAKTPMGAQIAQCVEEPKRLPARVGQIAAQQHQICALIDEALRQLPRVA